MKTGQWMISFILGLCFMSACNQLNLPQGEESSQLQEGQQVHSMMGRNTIIYDSEANETFIGKSLRSLNTPHPIEADDQLLIEGLIYDMPGVTTGMVSLIGEKAWVNVSFEEKGMTEEEEMKQKAYILERLTAANPSYEYQVIINHFMK